MAVFRSSHFVNEGKLCISAEVTCFNEVGPQGKMLSKQQDFADTEHVCRGDCTDAVEMPDTTLLTERT